MILLISSCQPYTPQIHPSSHDTGNDQPTAVAHGTNRPTSIISQPRQAHSGVGTNKKPLCVLDYDLTLSTHGCPGIPDDTKVCQTYEWNMEGLSAHANLALQRCIDEGAYVGILSSSPNSCIPEKIAHFNTLPAVTNMASTLTGFDFTKATSWNLAPVGPLYMNGWAIKHESINDIMEFYGLKPGADDAWIIFWDDDADNIAKMKTHRPQINSVRVARISEGGTTQGSPTSGCGITKADIEKGFELFKATTKN